MKTYEVLEKALALIEDPKDWTQGDYRIGDALCAEGACLIAGGGALEWDGERYTATDDFTADYERALDALWEFEGNIHLFNDSHSHAEVCDLFRRAIRNEKRKSGVLVDVPAKEKREDVHAEALA